ncbi:hypothetical protein [Chryseobacterium pennae]|nr:hypothetical protein [Chryseobacterium pennae]
MAERELPVLKLHGLADADFFVDALNDVLIDTKNASNQIHLLDMMLFEDHYEFIYDKNLRNVKEDNWGGYDKDDDRYAAIWIRPLEVYDIVGSKLYLEQHPLRVEGLQVISIKGIDYFWDDTTAQFMECENPFNRIHKSDTLYSFKTGEPGFYIDTDRKLPLYPHELADTIKMMRERKETELPSHIHFVSHHDLSKQIHKQKIGKSQSVTKKRNGRKL